MATKKTTSVAVVEKVLSVREQFRNGQVAAKTLVIGDSGTISGEAKEFSTGSLGWYFNGKVEVMMPDGTMKRCQFSGNLVVVGSKEM